VADVNKRPLANTTLLRKLVVVAVVMFGFGWAMVPLYRKICEVTGINLLTGRNPALEARLRNTQVDTSREVVIEFDANRQGPWRFKPHVNHLTVHPGELVTVQYELVNLQDHAMAGQAIPSYAPMQAARYFNKLECFCFKQQTLQGGESREFPVVFFVDPELPRDVAQITLSYTFFEIPGAAGKPQAQGRSAPRS
jgi:cytochrome c oxidase assembly protein subunit 11